MMRGDRDSWFVDDFGKMCSPAFPTGSHDPPCRMLKSEEFQLPVNNFIEENCMVFDNDSEHKYALTPSIRRPHNLTTYELPCKLHTHCFCALMTPGWSTVEFMTNSSSSWKVSLKASFLRSS